jgi:hypothetical protein
MCGLVAILTKLNNGFTENDKENFSDMLYADAVRGMDSTGAFLVTNLGNVVWGKARYNPVHLLITKEWDNMLDKAFKEGQFLVGHNRKATVGRVTDNTAHPFIEDNIILVHNGTLTNHKDIGNTEVDSHAICKSIAKKGHIETIKTLQGAFALIWYDINQKSLFVCRNDKRPLSLVETRNSYYLSSEVGLSKWIIERNNYSPKITKETEIKPGYLYEFSTDDPEKYTETEIELYKHPPFMPVVYDVKKNSIVTTPSKVITNINPEPKYKLGQYVPIYIDDYEQFFDAGKTNQIFGATYDQHQTQIQVVYSEKLFNYMMETENLIGKIKQISYNITTGIKTLILYPDSITNGTILESKNKVVEDSHTWYKEQHTCSKCNDKIEFYEVPDTVIIKKNKKNVLICEQCQKLNEKKVVNA